MSNPYASPKAPLPPKLTSADAADIRYRSLPVVAPLSLVTLGVYNFYLCYQWAKEINGLEGHVKHSPTLVLVLSIIPFGFVVGLPLGVAATVIVQSGFNELALGVGGGNI